MIAALSVFSAVACIDIDEYGTAFAVDDIVSVSLERRFEAGTRSVLGDVEGIEGGIVLGVYDSVTGRLDSEHLFDESDGTLELHLPSARKLDFYVAANMWYIDGSGEAKRFSFPKSKSSLASLVYRLDGSDAGSGLRFENFAEAAVFGIPMSGSLTGVNISTTKSVSIPLYRLFAKLRLTIDQSGLDGGKGESIFRNSKLYIRQANAALKPFSGSSSAASAGDLLPESDLDPEMADGRGLEFSFYIPENRSTEYPSYVEFTGIVDPLAGGYGGSVRYRFYIGPGGESYEVDGNKDYHITLGFKAGSLFDPSWSVSTGDDWNDGRNFGLAADSAGSKLLPDGQVIAVRPSRNGVCYLYFNKGGPGNQASALELCDGSFIPGDLTEGAWSWDAPGLASKGLSLSVSGNKLTFKVSDPSRFVPGLEVPLTLHLFPGDVEYNAVLRTYEDIRVEVEDGLSISEDFYAGMKRRISVSGLAGTKVYYWNSGFGDTQDLRASSSPDAPAISKSKSGKQSFDASSGCLELYARGLVTGSGFVLNLASDDTFNDGSSLLYEVVHVNMPLASIDCPGVVYLGIDGTEIDVGFHYTDNERHPIDRGLFDDSLYEQLLAPKTVYSGNDGFDLQYWVGSEDGIIWLKTFKDSSGRFIGELIDPQEILIGYLIFSPKDSDAAAGTNYLGVEVYPPYLSPRQSQVTADYFNQYGQSGLSYEMPLRLNGCTTFDVSLEGPGSQGASWETAGAGNERVFNWIFEDPESGIAEYVPYGEQRISLTFTNKHSGETYAIGTAFRIVHEFTLGVFMEFEEGAFEVRDIIVTSPKNAYGLKCMMDGTGGICDDYPFQYDAEYCRHIRMQVYKTSGRNSVRTVTKYGYPNYEDYTYEDFNPSSFGLDEDWSEENIDEFIRAGRSPFQALDFTASASSSTPLPKPLAAAYSGSEYIRPNISNRLIGYHIRH